MRHPGGYKPPKSSNGRHFRLHHSMTSLPVFKTMAPIAKALLLEILERHNGVNNGAISYSCREAEQAGVMNADTAVKAFEMLQERGFLRVARESSFDLKTTPSGNGISRTGSRAREWRITFLPGLNGEKPTMDFLAWEPGKPTLEKKKPVRRRRTQRPKLSDTNVCNGA